MEVVSTVTPRPGLAGGGQQASEDTRPITVTAPARLLLFTASATLDQPWLCLESSPTMGLIWGGSHGPVPSAVVLLILPRQWKGDEGGLVRWLLNPQG